jgi:predicted transcriptional regulator of viral defense system
MKNAKTLGPAATGVLLRLAEQGKKTFSVADAQAIYNKSPKVTANLLHKLTEKGWLVRLKAGTYLIVPLEAGFDAIPMADRYVIAGEVLGSVPYYISHYSAMEIHQMTTQPAHTVYATVSGQRQGRVIAGVEYYFVYASKRFFWGWHMMWVNAQDQVPVSDLEKTVPCDRNCAGGWPSWGAACGSKRTASMRTAWCSTSSGSITKRQPSA